MPTNPQIGTDYDHIDAMNLGAGTGVVRHMLKDAQAREDVSELKSATDELSTDTYSVIGGKQRFDQKTFNLNNEYVNAYTTKYLITWTANTKLYFKLVANSEVVPSYLLYVVDSEDTAHNMGSKSPNTEITINVDYAIKAVYAYYGTKVTTSITYLFYREYASTVATKTELQTAVTTVDNKYSAQIGGLSVVDGASITWEQGYINPATGAFTGHESWKSTPYVSVMSGCDYIVAVANSSSSVGVAWYDADKHYVDGEALVYNHSYVGEFDLTAPQTARYMRFSTTSITASTAYAKADSSLLEIDDQIYKQLDGLQAFEPKENIYWQLAMDKVLCIGDSLTSGAYYDGDTFNGASIAQNYPYFLSRILDTDVTNAGVSGISVVGWLDEQSDNYTYTDYNTIIVWLGSNYGLRTDLPENATEGQTKAYNNFVAYKQLLTKIQTANPNALIVMCKIYFTNYWVDISNSALESIATEYGLPLVDLSDLNATNYPDYRYVDENKYHLIKCGNIAVASRIAESMKEWFGESPKRCEFGLSPRVN